MTLKQVRDDVEAIIGKGWVYFEKCQVVHEAIIEKFYPHVDVELLCELYDEHKGYQDEIVTEYVRRIRERELERLAIQEL